jgi:hypothetical protein
MKEAKVMGGGAGGGVPRSPAKMKPPAPKPPRQVQAQQWQNHQAQQQYAPPAQVHQQYAPPAQQYQQPTPSVRQYAPPAQQPADVGFFGSPTAAVSPTPPARGAAQPEQAVGPQGGGGKRFHPFSFKASKGRAAGTSPSRVAAPATPAVGVNPFLTSGGALSPDSSVRCSFSDRTLSSRSVVEFHAFAPLKALPCM